jgi:ribonuclease P protein component
MVLKNSFGYARIGLTVTKKIGNAVKRNLIKRRLREASKSLIQSSLSYDFVIIARKPIVEANFQQIRDSLQKTIHQLLGKRQNDP